MKAFSALCLTAVLVSAPLATSCKKQADPPPAPPPTITQSTFEPVYRATKALQGATTAGVTYAKFGELMQDLSTEIGIAKDHQMNHLDKQLIAVYDEAFAAYQFSAQLWERKFHATEGDSFSGEIPLTIIGVSGESMLAALAKYKVPVIDKKTEILGARMMAVSEDSISLVWLAADELLHRATDMYYARVPSGEQAPSKQ